MSRQRPRGNGTQHQRHAKILRRSTNWNDASTMLLPTCGNRKNSTGRHQMNSARRFSTDSIGMVHNSPPTRRHKSNTYWSSIITFLHDIDQIFVITLGLRLSLHRSMTTQSTHRKCLHRITLRMKHSWISVNARLWCQNHITFNKCSSLISAQRKPNG